MSVRGDRRRIKQARVGTMLPPFVKSVHTKNADLTSSNYKEIVGLISYVNNEIMPLVQRTTHELERIRCDVEDLRQKIQVLELKRASERTEVPTFELYPLDSDSSCQ